MSKSKLFFKLFSKYNVTIVNLQETYLSVNSLASRLHDGGENAILNNVDGETSAN